MEFFGSRGPSEAERMRENYIRRKLTEALAGSLRHLEHKYVSAEEPIYSEDSANSVCNVIEAIFMHGLKSSTSVTSKMSTLLIGPEVGKIPQPSFWEVLKKITHRDGIQQLNHLGQITTEIGMCRAWIRIALNEGLMESYLDALFQDKSSLRCHYKQTAYLRDEEQRDIMKTFIQGLQAFIFELSYNSSVLNIWTTTPLVLAGIIEPLVKSRTTTAVINKAASVTSPPAASPAEAVVGASASHSEVQVTHNRSSKSRPSRVISSIGYVSENPEGASMPAPPPNTPYNSGLLTQMDIDVMRHMSRKVEQAGSASTPASQISSPDPARRDEEPNVLLGLQKSILERTVDAATSESNDEEFTDAQQSFDNEGDGASGFDEHNGGNEVNDGEVETYTREDFEDAEDDDEDTGMDREVFNIMKVPLADEKSDTSEKRSNHGEGSLENSTSSDANAAITTSARTNHSRSSEAGSSSQDIKEALSLSRQQSPFHHIRRKSQPLEPEEVRITAENPSYDEVAQAASPSHQEQISFIFQPSIYDKIRMPTPQSNSLGSGQMRGWSSEFEDADDVSPVAIRTVRAIRSENSEILGNSQPTASIPMEVGKESVIVLEEEVLREAEDPFMTEDGRINEAKTETPKTTEPVKMATRNDSHLSGESGPSYDDLLNSYGPAVPLVGTPNMNEVLDALGHSSPSEESRSSPDEPSQESMDYPADYEILAVGPSCNEDMHRKELADIIGVIMNEKGLDSQNFQCQGCSRPIGIIYGNPRLCTYDACYYCFECHENEDYFIPSRIVCNWDFTRFKVCTGSLEFLKEVEELPMLNIQQLNPKLYEHVREMKEALEVRTQLRYLKAYLFTCRQSVADELRKQVWPKEYLYEDVHLYSLQDLLNVQMGYFCGGIRKLIKFASKHVYDCRLCSQKGFICEICQNPKVIYPFEVETTSQCEVCQSVYHKNCMTSKPPCPKCERLRRRSLPPDPEAMDYACLPDQDSL